VYQVHQHHAIETFTTMLARAESYVTNPSVNDSDMFYSGYGICDNIARCSPDGACDTTMALIKDNVIRRVPSYSGNYHYPVKHPAPKENLSHIDAAENAYCEFSNKWTDGYGAHRIQQLRELLDYVTNQWDDALTQTLTPCVRVGIIKDVTVVQRIADGDLYTLQYDDGSTDPYFIPLGGNPDDRRSIDLRRIIILSTVVQQERTVVEFLTIHAATVSKRLAIEASLAALKAEIDALKCEENVLDYALGQQHGVKRLAK
jgi:hypothetical protein